jgi:inner membrane protein
MMIGAAAGAALVSQAPVLGLVTGTLIGAVGGLVPDLDHPNSKATRSIAPIAIGGSRRYSMVLMSLGILFLAWQGHLPYDGVIAIACWLLVAALSKHRGITHSLVGLASAAYAVHTWLGDSWVIFAAGYGSHLLADMVTDRGVPILWPIKFDFSLPTGFSTGGTWSSLVEKFIQLLCFLYLLKIAVENVLS